MMRDFQRPTSTSGSKSIPIGPHPSSSQFLVETALILENPTAQTQVFCPGA
jgi:hypothetical protein